MSNEFKIKIDNYKLKYLFYNIRKLQGAKNLLAKKLGISIVTLDEYLATGENYLEKFDEKLQDIYNIDIEDLDNEIIKRKNNYIDEFLALENERVISDKNKNLFEVFFIDKKEKLKEEVIYSYQKNIIENIQWSENEDENKKIKILMQFKLIYDRAQMSLDEELLYLKNRYSKSSTRNVSVIIKDLERRNKEDFAVEKDDTKKITVNQQFNNFTHFSIEQDKAMGLLGKRDNEVIEIEPLVLDD